MFFPDYNETGYIYHMVSISDLKDILENGLKYNDKATYENKYSDFHRYIDLYKPKDIPDWVKREYSIYGTMNYPKDYDWHSHSAILGVTIDTKRCWVASESLANKIYEPFILKDIDIFKSANDYLSKNGEKMCKEFWESSLSFTDNLDIRKDKNKAYDDEILILHDIDPDNIKLLYIISEKEFTNVESWNDYFLQKS